MARKITKRGCGAMVAHRNLVQTEPVEGLRMSLISVCCSAAVVSTLLYVIAGRTLLNDLRAQGQASSPRHA